MVEIGIKISELPETKTVALSDLIYSFKSVDNTAVPELVPISELSSYIYSSTKVSTFKNLYKNFQTLSSNFMKFINENYPTEAQLKKIFIKTSDFNNIINEHYTVDSVISTDLSEYGTLAYNDNLKREAMAMNKSLKRQYSASIASEIGQMMEISPDAGDD